MFENLQQVYLHGDEVKSQPYDMGVQVYMVVLVHEREEMGNNGVGRTAPELSW